MKLCGGDGGGRKIIWEKVAQLVDGATGKQCYNRWYYYINPALNKCNREPFWTDEEVCWCIGKLLLFVLV